MTRLALALVVLLGACGKNEEPPPPSNVNLRQESAPHSSSHHMDRMGGGAPVAVGGDAAAADLFQSRCVMCHGADGTGTGQAAAALNPKPRDYTDAAWQASVTDDVIAQTIVKGGQAMGKSATMPANPDLADQPQVVAGLVKIIRAFGTH